MTQPVDPISRSRQRLLTGRSRRCRRLPLKPVIHGQTLRSSDFRRQILTALINGATLPAKAGAVSLRNCRRALENYRRRTGQAAGDFFELEPAPPAVARQALLAVCDEQFCQLFPSVINAHIVGL